MTPPLSSSSTPNSDLETCVEKAHALSISEATRLNICLNVTRCRDRDGFYGTIRYVGPVASSSAYPHELYAGIEWDDTTRGKHDGSVVCRKTKALVRHFKCLNDRDRNGSSCSSSTGASFVKLKKLDLGCTLTPSLLQSRYVQRDAELVAPGNILPNQYALTSSGKQKKPIELWGEVELRERQQWFDLRALSLRGLGIARAFSFEDLQEEEKNKFMTCLDLDLAGNLFSDWNQLCAILLQFPNLQKLSMASNRLLNLPPLASLSTKYKFDKLKVLNLNHCGITSFQTVLDMDGNLLPHLVELCLAGNDLSDMHQCLCPNDAGDALSTRQFHEDLNKKEIEADTHKDGSVEPLAPRGTQIYFRNVLRDLTLLDCSSCIISSWEHQIRRLAMLLNLKTLILNDNPLTHLSCPMGDDASGKTDHANVGETDQEREFENLTSLHLSGCKFGQSQTSIDFLPALFPNLRALRFKGCPITSGMSEAEARSMILARTSGWKSLVHLNGSAVPEREKREAERRYVTSVMREFVYKAKRQKQHEAQHQQLSLRKEGSRTEKEHEEEDVPLECLLRAEHPRFHELWVRYNPPLGGFDLGEDAQKVLFALGLQDAVKSLDLKHAKPASIGSTGSTLAYETVQVTISSMAASSFDASSANNNGNESMTKVTKRLPPNMTVDRLKAMVQRIWGVHATAQVLHCRVDGDHFPTELDNDERTLSFYGVVDDSEILVNET